LTTPLLQRLGLAASGEGEPPASPAETDVDALSEAELDAFLAGADDAIAPA
jgi:hypothetical protein